MTITVGQINTNVLCPVHKMPMRLKDSRFGKFYGCDRYPTCRETHGAHPNGEPLGTPADAETKQWRILAHAAFDTLWKRAWQSHCYRVNCQPPQDGDVITKITRSARNRAYLWLAQRLGLDRDDCHIGMFDGPTCERVLEACREATPETVRAWYKSLPRDQQRTGT